MIRIEVEGRPAPKGSRFAQRTKEGKLYTVPCSKFEKPWIDAVAEATRQVMRHHDTPEPPYAVELEIALEMPAKKNRNHMRPWPASRDLDKLARAVIDGLVKGGAMQDDRHIIEIVAVKRWAADGEAAGARAVVRRVTAQVEVAA